MKNTYLVMMIMALVSFCVLACGQDVDKSTTKKTAKKSKKVAKKATKKKAAETKTMDAAVSGATPEQLAKAKEIIASIDPALVDAVDAKKKYKTFCATCHGFKGKLNINGAKDLSISKISLEESVAQIYHGKGLMTPFKGVLKDEEIIAVAKYIEGLRK